MDETSNTLETIPDPEVIITAMVDDLVAALINTRIYWADHPRVLDSCRAVLRQIKKLCAENNCEHIDLAVTSEFLVYEDRPLLGATLGASRLGDCATRRRRLCNSAPTSASPLRTRSSNAVNSSQTSCRSLRPPSGVVRR